ncbi:MAG: methyl-accepting chemotaxis protein [Lachnospiraceae bacterium]|nr:methyl-accepting chemotaxis protein [Lachnospiraceae bacterium]
MEAKEKSIKKKGKISVSLAAKVVAVSVIAVLIIAIAAVMVSILESRKSMVNQSKDYLYDLTCAYGEELELDCRTSEGYLYNEEYAADRNTYTSAGMTKVSSSYGYIVSGDGTMLVHPTPSKVGQPVTNEVILGLCERIQNGEDLSEESDVVEYKFNGTMKYAAYYVLPNNEAIFVATADEDEIIAEINGARNQAIIITIIFVIIASGIMYALIKLFLKSLVKTIANTEAMASGDLTNVSASSAMNKGDEVEKLVDSYNGLQGRLSEIVKDILLDADELKDSEVQLENTIEANLESLDNVLTAVEEIAKGATSQAQYTQECTNSLLDLDSSVESIEDAIENLGKATDVSFEATTNAKNSMAQLLDINNKTKENIDVIVEQSEKNVTECKNITEFVEVIRNIASQTSLLSLNASIEAARAGEAGRGFAVVAEEIKKLSEESAKATEEIDAIIKKLTDEINETSRMVENLSNTANVQIETLNTTSGDFAKVEEGMNLISDTRETLNESVNGVIRAKESMSNQVNDLSALAEENAASCEETSASAIQVRSDMDGLRDIVASIDAVSSKLNDQMGIFKV